MSTDARAEEFFERYRRALLDRDATAVASLYAVPALIEFPGQAIAVSSAAQTEQFFAGAFAQYEGVTDVSTQLDVVAETGHSLWVDVTWSYDGAPPERFIYQLVLSPDDWRIAVLTPLDT